MVFTGNSRATKMKLSVLIPCFNERNIIEEILTRVETCAYQQRKSSSSTTAQPMAHATFSGQPGRGFDVERVHLSAPDRKNQHQ